MNERPQDDGGMFFVGMKFHPDENLKQSDLNRIVVHLLRHIFRTWEGEPFPVKNHESSMLMLVQFLVDLDITLDDKTFADIPEDLRKYFQVIHRDGTKYRYGRKPRFL